MDLTTINGDQGVWLGGKPHFLYYFSEQGKLLRDTVRLAGNVLVWQQGNITLRVEGQLSEERAIQVAESMRNG